MNQNGLSLAPGFDHVLLYMYQHELIRHIFSERHIWHKKDILCIFWDCSCRYSSIESSFSSRSRSRFILVMSGGFGPWRSSSILDCRFSSLFWVVICKKDKISTDYINLQRTKFQRGKMVWDLCQHWSHLKLSVQKIKKWDFKEEINNYFSAITLQLPCKFPIPR